MRGPGPRLPYGRSLIELMISITIGLFITAVAMSLFIRSKSSYLLHHENGRMREDAQSALNLIGRNLRQAGYTPIAATTFNQPLSQSTYLPGPGLRGCDFGFSVASKNDFSCGSQINQFPAIEVRYVVDQDYSSAMGIGADCNGQEVKLNADGIEFAEGDIRYAINRFYLSKKKGDAFATLYCIGNGNNVAQPILSNVEDLSLMYGLDINDDLVPDRYVSAAEVNELSNDQEGNWKKVISVELCLQVASDSKMAGNARQKSVDCTGAEKSSSDRYLRSVFRTAFTLRNNAAPTIDQEI